MVIIQGLAGQFSIDWKFWKPFFLELKVFGPATCWNTLERKRGEPAQVRKFDFKIVLKRQHLRRKEAQVRKIWFYDCSEGQHLVQRTHLSGTMVNQLRFGSKIALKRQHLLQIWTHWAKCLRSSAGEKKLVLRLYWRGSTCFKFEHTWSEAWRSSAGEENLVLWLSWRGCTCFKECSGAEAWWTSSGEKNLVLRLSRRGSTCYKLEYTEAWISKNYCATNSGSPEVELRFCPWLILLGWPNLLCVCIDEHLHLRSASGDGTSETVFFNF